MMERRYGQSSMEFLAFVALSALILAAMYSTMTQKQIEASRFENNREAQIVTEKVSFQAEMAKVQRDGYSRVFTVPEEIGGERYNITLVNRTAIFKRKNDRITFQTLYSGDEINLTTNDTNVFRVVNKEGEVDINEE